MSDNDLKNPKYIAARLEAMASPDRFNDSACELLKVAASLIREHVPARTDVSDCETRAYMTRWLMNCHYAEAKQALDDMFNGNDYSYQTVKVLYLKYHG